MPQEITWENVLLVLGIFCGVGLGGAVTLLVLAFQQIKEIDIPEDADFFETLQLIPITIPMALDFLDLAFDFLGAPVAWIILEMLGLRALQMVTIFESLIPATQIIPTMTICWFVAKGMKRKDTPFRTALRGYQSQTKGRYGSLARGRSSLNIANKYRSTDLLGSGDVDLDALDGDIVDGGEDDFDGDYREEEV